MEESRPSDDISLGKTAAEADQRCAGFCCSTAEAYHSEDRAVSAIGEVGPGDHSGKSDGTAVPCNSAAVASDDCCEDDKAKGEALSEMACTSGCCAEKQVDFTEANGKNSAAETPKRGSGEDANEMLKPECQDGCCSDAVPESVPESTDCKAGCCDSASNSSDESPSESFCCDQKPNPCCNEECLERAVQRECTPCGKGREARNDPCSDAQGKGRAHDAHACSVREFYEATLKSFGCLCRTLIAQGKQSCCVSSARGSFDRGVRSGRITKRSSARSSSSSLARVGQKPQCQVGCCAEPKGKAELSKESASTHLTAAKDVKNEATESDVIDIERGAIQDPEHVILSVSGMTCTGCEVKLQRTLAQMKHLKNVQASLVLSRAEFDLEPGSASVDVVIQRLAQATDFKVEQIFTSGAELDVIPTGDMQAFLDQSLPLGVNDLRKIDKHVVRVRFDPIAIGARDLLSTDVLKYPAEVAPLRPDASIAAGRRHAIHLGLMTSLSTILTIPVLVMAWAPIAPRPIPYGAASLALGTIIQFVVAGPFYPQAIKSLVLLGVIEMDLLIVLSTTASYIFSVTAFGYLVAGRELSTGEFFETSTLLVTLIMVGRFVSALARQKAVESISLRSLQAPRALLVDQVTKDVTDIDARLLQFGDFFKVMPESRIPTDGTVISGTSEVDESMLTGESIPVAKSAKSAVVAGSLNGSGTLIVRLTRLPGDNTITSIASMIDEAKLSKPKIQATADRVASFFVPVIIGVAVIVFVTWIAVGMTLRHYSSSEAAINAITYAITVLIVSCPCAIGLAVPMVIVIASGVAAKQGFIFKSAETIEVAYKTTHVVFDKTGTLLEGKFAVDAETYTDATLEQETVSGILAGLVSNVKHPVSIAVATMLKDRGVVPISINNVTAVPGKGVEGVWNGKTVRAGNAFWMAQDQNSTVKDFFSRGYTVLVLQIGTSTSAILGLVDKLRPSALEIIPALQSCGIKVAILSGDNEGAVSNAAASLNITDYRALCTPSDKRDYLRGIVERDPRAVTLFVGDGTNDAPALAQATIGIHISEGGTDVAASAADAVLVSPDLTGILRLISLSRAAMRRIAFNFAWSFIYNILALLLASGALVVARIPPQFGGLGELVSVLPVIAIALQLRWSGSAKRV